MQLNVLQKDPGENGTYTATFTIKTQQGDIFMCIVFGDKYSYVTNYLYHKNNDIRNTWIERTCKRVESYNVPSKIALEIHVLNGKHTNLKSNVRDFCKKFDIKECKSLYDKM